MAGQACLWSRTARKSSGTATRDSGRAWKVHLRCSNWQSPACLLCLVARGYTLTFRDIRNASPSNEELLARYEEKQYDGAIIFAPSAKCKPSSDCPGWIRYLTWILPAALPADLSPQALFSYITTSLSSNDIPGNLLIALSPQVSETWRDFAREFSIEFDERDTALFDPVHSSKSATPSVSAPVVDVPSSLTFSAYPVLDSLDSSSSIVSRSTIEAGKPIRYSGLVHQAIDLPLLTPVLRAPATSYPVDLSSAGNAVVEGGPLVAGEQAKLVSAFQARPNSRVVWSGSLDLFSNAFNTPETGNEAFIADLSSWTFGEKGIVRIESARHYAALDSTAKTQKEQYRIGEEMVYELVLSEWTGDKWAAPSPAALTDLQLEVTMLDPHLRIPVTASTELAHRSATSRTYTARFKLPDRHGVFTLLVDHRRQGMSWLESKMQISVTPLRHDEYERFITGAMPYYITAGSMVVAWLAFSALWLGIKEHDERGKGKKKLQ